MVTCFLTHWETRLQQKLKPTRKNKDAEKIKPEVVDAQETKKLKTKEKKKPLIEVVSSHDVDDDKTAEKSTSPNVATNNGQNVELDSKAQLGPVKKTEDRERHLG